MSRWRVNNNKLLIKREERRKKGTRSRWKESGYATLGHNGRWIQDRHGRERQ
ncbi:MAG TPA: hypothetical protein VIW25_06000 [Nitrososphaeraceae archaeon]